MISNVNCYLVFGPQGSGKSTQGKLLSEALMLPYFDAGDQLRALSQTDSEEGKRVHELMQLGRLVENATLSNLLEDFITKHNCEKGIVVDGFPRNLAQAKLLDEIVNDHHWKIVGFYIDINDETAKERLAGRYQMVNGKKVVREDDQPAIVAKRLEVFKRDTMPVVEYLEKNYQLYRIDGTPSIADVHEAVMSKING